MKSSHLNQIRQWSLWLLRLRWLAWIGLVSVLSASQVWWKFSLNYTALWVLSSILLIYNILYYILGHGLAGITILTDKPSRYVTFTSSQTLIDLILLTFILHYWGGVENPFIFFYIFYVTISNLLFNQRTSYLVALLASLLFNTMIWLEYTGIYTHYHLNGLVPESLYRNPYYLMSLSFTLPVIFFTCAYLTGYLAKQILQREEELKKAHESLQEYSLQCENNYKELMKLHKEKSEFMRKVAHELRAPLSAVQSCLQVVLEIFGKQLPTKPRELIERAERRSGSLIFLVRDLLNLSRANELLQKAVFEPVNLHYILVSVIELEKPRAESKGIEIQSEFDSTQMVIKADKGGIDEVFTNLLSNAVKYSPPKTTVKVIARETSDSFEISFIDQGIGISATDMPMLFSEFFRTANAKELHVEGTGLGLTLSKKIVEIHKGKIEVTSEFGKGSCFKVTLPKN